MPDHKSHYPYDPVRKMYTNDGTVTRILRPAEVELLEESMAEFRKGHGRPMTEDDIIGALNSMRLAMIFNDGGYW